MHCPVCQKEMIEEDFGGVKVNTCKNGCKGIWFDWQEIIRLDDDNEGFGNALKEALKYPRVNDSSRGHINCPKCSFPMHMHKFESNKEVNVDECYSCGGFFLDSGELDEIREHHMSEEEEKEYANKLLKNMPSYQAELTDLAHDEARTDAIKKYTRFIRLSYYMRGQ